MQQALGLIEVIALAAGIEAADAAVKSANVSLIGYEMAKGDAMVTVKVAGDVGAVTAAIDAAKVAAAKVGTVVSVKVIPRPAQGIMEMVHSKDTVGLEVANKPAPEPAPKPIAEEAPAEPVSEQAPQEESPKDNPKEELKEESKEVSKDNPKDNPKEESAPVSEVSPSAEPTNTAEKPNSQKKSSTKKKSSKKDE
jgi:microcompartment protein CcmL/EutN